MFPKLRSPPRLHTYPPAPDCLLSARRRTTPFCPHRTQHPFPWPTPPSASSPYSSSRTIPSSTSSKTCSIAGSTPIAARCSECTVSRLITLPTTCSMAPAPPPSTASSPPCSSFCASATASTPSCTSTGASSRPWTAPKIHSSCKIQCSSCSSPQTGSKFQTQDPVLPPHARRPLDRCRPQHGVGPRSRIHPAPRRSR